MPGSPWLRLLEKFLFYVQSMLTANPDTNRFLGGMGANEGVAGVKEDGLNF